ncbi:MAG: hypothetical protein ACLFP2_03390 [Candidatus Woesearchaeota archaeon]
MEFIISEDLHEYMPGVEIDTFHQQSHVSLLKNNLVMKWGDLLGNQPLLEDLCFGLYTSCQNACDRHDFEQSKLIGLYAEGLDVVEPVITDYAGIVLTRLFEGFPAETEDELGLGLESLNRLHLKGHYHGDAHPDNLLFGDGLRWIDFGTRVRDDVSFIQAAARDLRDYLLACTEYASPSFVRDCFEQYKGGEVKDDLRKQLDTFREDFIDNWIERGYGNPYILREII